MALKLVDDKPEPKGWQESVLQQIEDNGGVDCPLGPAKMIAVYKSKSDPMDFHYVIDFTWIVVCTCKGYRFRSDCTHTRDYFDGK